MSAAEDKIQYDLQSPQLRVVNAMGQIKDKLAGNRSLLPILYLTLGWFGIQMAMALDATMFQKLLGEQLDNATMIGLVLGLGPLAGFTLQPMMGWLGDKLLRRGITRRKVMGIALVASLLCTLAFALPLSLPWLITAIAVFFAAFNILAVNYRASVTEISNRKALLAHRGTVSGFLGGFGGLGGFAMFALVSASGGTPMIPVIASAVILLATFIVMYKFAPSPKPALKVVKESPESVMPAELPASITADAAVETDTQSKTPEAARHEKAMWSKWNIAFYVLPVLGLIPAYEKKLDQAEGQLPIFRLFLTVFFSWMGIQALRGFFVLFATKSLGLEFAQANIPLAVLTLVMLVAAPLLGKMGDKYDSTKILRGSLVLYALSCLGGYFWVHDLTGLIVLSVIIGISFAGMVVMPLGMLFKMCPKNNEGTYVGFYNLFVSVPQLYSLFITGRLIDYVHDYRVILLVGAAAVALAVMSSFRMTSGKTDFSVA